MFLQNLFLHHLFHSYQPQLLPLHRPNLHTYSNPVPFLRQDVVEMLPQETVKIRGLAHSRCLINNEWMEDRGRSPSMVEDKGMAWGQLAPFMSSK